MLQQLACHGGIALEQGLMLHDSFVHGKGCTYVLHDGSHVDRDSGRSRHLTADDSIDELFLTALRVALLQGDDLYLIIRVAKALGTLLGEQGDGGGLVGLDADVAAVDLGGLHQQFQSYEYLVGLLHHQPVVGCDVGLALYGIDDDALSLGCRRRGQFDECGEAGTAHTGDACHLDALDNLFGCQFGMTVYGLQLLRTVDALLPFVALNVDDDGRLAVARSIDDGVNLDHRAADRRIDGGRHKAAGLGYERTHLDVVALLDNGLGGGSYMLAQGEDGLLG